MGGRAVEGTGLENRQGWKLFVGSNPTPSAIFLSVLVTKCGAISPPVNRHEQEKPHSIDKMPVPRRGF